MPSEKLKDEDLENVVGGISFLKCLKPSSRNYMSPFQKILWRIFFLANEKNNEE